MNCRTAEARLFAAADHTLALEASLELDAHVHECARCAELAHELAVLEDTLARAPQPPLDTLDVDAHVRAVRAAIEARARPRPARRWVPWLVSATAAALVALWWSTRATDREVVRTPPIAAEPRTNVAPAPPQVVQAPAANVARETAPADSAPFGTAPVESAPSDAALVDNTPVDSALVDSNLVDGVPSAAPPALTEQEVERWEAARRALGAALVAALETSRDAGRDALAADFAARTRELGRANWPVARLAEGLTLARSPDIACAALRYLGLHGERSNVRALQRALASPALAPDAVLALADLGDTGGDVAADALLALEPALRDAALARIAEAHDARAAAWLETLARRALRPRSDAKDAATRAEFARRALDTLPDTGAPAVEKLLRLAADGLATEESTHARLMVTPGAEAELARLLARATHAYPAELLLGAVEQLRPSNGPAWLAALAASDRELRATAVAALAHWDDEHAARELVALHGAGRIQREVLSAALARLVERAPQAAAELVRTCTRERDRAALQLVATEITSVTRSECTPALLALAESELLPRGDRKSALLEAGELATADDAASLATLFRALDVRERELRAACVLPLHALGGAAAIRELFPRANARALERVLVLLADPRANTRPTTTLIRVAQELDALEPRAMP